VRGRALGFRALLWAWRTQHCGCRLCWRRLLSIDQHYLPLWPHSHRTHWALNRGCDGNWNMGGLEALVGLVAMVSLAVDQDQVCGRLGDDGRGGLANQDHLAAWGARLDGVGQGGRVGSLQGRLNRLTEVTWNNRIDASYILLALTGL